MGTCSFLSRLALCWWAGCAVLSMAQAQPASTAQPEPVQWPQIYATVFQVLVPTATGAVQQGSAVIVEPGWAVTSCHVMGEAMAAWGRVGGESFRTPLRAAHRFHDLCLLQVPDNLGRPRPRRASADVRPGEPSFALGFGAGRRTATHGPIIALHPLDGGQVLQTEATFVSGASGGGLFDAQARLLGVLTTYRPNDVAPVYLVAPSEWIDDLLSRREAGALPSKFPDGGVPFWDVAGAGPATPAFMRALVFGASGQPQSSASAAVPARSVPSK